jgi:hypothetical protein
MSNQFENFDDDLTDPYREQFRDQYGRDFRNQFQTWFGSPEVSQWWAGLPQRGTQSRRQHESALGDFFKTHPPFPWMSGAPGGGGTPQPTMIPFPGYSQGWAFQGAGHPIAQGIPRPMLPLLNIDLSKASKSSKGDNE